MQVEKVCYGFFMNITTNEILVTVRPAAGAAAPAAAPAFNVHPRLYTPLQLTSVSL